MLNILADKYLYNIQSYLPENINLTLFDPAGGLPESVQSAHGILVRTVIPINRQTLPKIPDQLSFVGTGSAGTDHVDINYLHKNGVSFSDAAGCNARSVAEYTATALLMWTDQKNKKVEDLTVGIVGVGHVGTQVQRLLEDLNFNTVAYDPPRELQESGFESVNKTEILNCDILTFHTPLTTTGDFPTYHWLGNQQLSDRHYEVIINTARGGVIDEQAVLNALEKGQVRDIIVDVWEQEPNIDFTIAQKAFIKTPHIAGYSIQAKENASRIVADALLDHFDLAHPEREIQDQHRIVKKDISLFNSLSELLSELHPTKKYESRLIKIIEEHPWERGKHFNKLRAEFPLRHEFAHIYLPASFFDRYPILRKMGFSEKSEL